MEGRITSDNITKLLDNEVFVFGSNLVGKHGKGAAKTALKFGAKWGQGAGLQGMSYGIPTKGTSMKQTLPIDEIKVFVDEFIQFAKQNKKCPRRDKFCKCLILPPKLNKACVMGWFLLFFQYFL